MVAFILLLCQCTGGTQTHHWNHLKLNSYFCCISARIVVKVAFISIDGSLAYGTLLIYILYIESTSTQEQLQHWAFTRSCEWHTSPSRAPHFGGLWESAVKSMKRLLKKSLSEQILRVDELQTYLLEAAAVMNSRPMAPESSETHSSDGVAPLTPAHFLTGGPVTALPSDPDPAKSYSYSKRWSYLQRLTTDLWR